MNIQPYRFQWRCRFHIFSQLSAVRRGRPYHVFAFRPLALSWLWEASLQQDRTKSRLQGRGAIDGGILIALKHRELAPPPNTFILRIHRTPRTTYLYFRGCTCEPKNRPGIAAANSANCRIRNGGGTCTIHFSFR